MASINSEKEVTRGLRLGRDFRGDFMGEGICLFPGLSAGEVPELGELSGN